MLKLNFRKMTKKKWKVSFMEEFRKAGILGFGNSGFSRRQPGEGADDRTHSHADTEEIYITMSGKAIATVDGERITLDNGDILIIQAGEEHKIEAASDSVHENLWIEPDKIRFLTPLKDGKKYLYRTLKECPSAPCPFGESTRVITGEDTPAASIYMTRITDSRRHYHKLCMEYHHVLEGTGKLDVADDTVDLKPGVTVVIPPKVPHRACGNLRLLIVDVPTIEPEDEYFGEP